MRVRYSGDDARVVAEHLDRAASGSSSPMNSLSEVVLPAPFEPSSPVIPSPISKLTSSSARTEPYDFVSSRAASRAIRESVSAPLPEGRVAGRRPRRYSVLNCSNGWRQASQ